MTLPTSVETIITEAIVEDILDDDALLAEIVEIQAWLHEEEGYTGNEDEDL